MSEWQLSTHSGHGMKSSSRKPHNLHQLMLFADVVCGIERELAGGMIQCGFIASMQSAKMDGQWY